MVEDHQSGKPVAPKNDPKPRNVSKSVRFSTVVVFSFPREQGFSSVPDTGWCSLGMSRTHQTVSRFEVHHHQLLQRLRRRRFRLSQKRRMASSANPLVTRIRNRCRGGVKNGEHSRLSPGDSCRVPTFPSPPPLSPQPFSDSLMRGDSCGPIASDSNVLSTPPPPCLSPPSPRRVLGHFDDSLAMSNSYVIPETFDTDSEASLDQVPAIKTGRSIQPKKERSKLMPIHGAARIKILKESGISRLDESEREECLRIRATRSRVGCDCGPRHPCTPGRCSCIEDGVQCQVDRPSFPCSCTLSGCHNPNGRTEFSQEEVRAHVRNVLSRFTIQNEDSPNQVNQPPSLICHSDARLPSPETLCTLSTPLSIVSPGSMASQATVSTSKNVPPPNPIEFEVSTPIRGQSPQQSDHMGPVANKLYDQASSTPAPVESTFRRALFQDPDVTNQMALDLSVPICRLESPNLSPTCGVALPSQEEIIIIHSSSSDSESDRLVPVSSAPNNCTQKMGSRLHNQQTAFPRKKQLKSRNVKQLLIKSFSVIPDTRRNSAIFGSPVCPSSISNACSPGKSSDWFIDLTTSPPSTPTVPNTSPSRSPVPLSWDAIGAADQITTNCLTESRGDYPMRLSSSTHVEQEDTHIVNASTSMPFFSPTMIAEKMGTRNYAKYRMKGVPFTSNSAPNSPCSTNISSLGRLSLRRRAIPRLPVTPSRRLMRTPSKSTFKLLSQTQSNQMNNVLATTPHHCQDDRNSLVEVQKVCAPTNRENSTLLVHTRLPSVSSNS